MKTTIATLGIAALLWFILFVIKPLNFWLGMSLSISLLVLMVLLITRGRLGLDKISLRKIIIGITSAALLYLIFYVGNIISGYLFPFKNEQISSVYSNGYGVSPIVIGLLLLFVIGPGEEIYWRGFIQKMFSEKYGENIGYLLSVIFYTAVHALTGNFMLVLAALVCAMFWGYLYKKEKSLITVIISHAIWDLTAFVLLPFQ